MLFCCLNLLLLQQSVKKVKKSFVLLSSESLIVVSEKLTLCLIRNSFGASCYININQHFALPL